jgi:hypothetical protein
MSDLPNGQKTQYAYFDNLGDQRLKEIKNVDPSSAVISQFDYTYNPVGNIFELDAGELGPSERAKI